MLRSIRARLLLWYALILAAVIAVFCVTLSMRVWSSQVAQIDALLLVQAHRVQKGLELAEGAEDDEDAAEILQMVSQTAPGNVDIHVWDAKGRPVFASKDAAAVERPTVVEERFRGTRREVILPGADGALVLAGRDAAPEIHAHREFRRLLVAVGGFVFLFAMAGGWFLAGRALAPIERITKTASQVTASDMSRRIDVGDTESELGRLATTLNVTFDRLEAAFDRQTRFTADASHELRTPLSILMTHAELAMKRDRSPEEYKETLATCLKAAQRMKAVVEGLLTLARADAREANLQKERVELKGVVDEAAAMLAPVAAERKVALAVTADAAAVEGDRARLGEVVVNLVSNAIRYNREGGRVTVGLRAADGAAVLTVADTGIGIPEKDQPHIFERFYRVDKARSREMGGTGLGLAISRWVVEAHGGTIAFESREGEGTTFTVTLPRTA